MAKTKTSTKSSTKSSTKTSTKSSKNLAALAKRAGISLTSDVRKGLEAGADALVEAESLAARASRRCTRAERVAIAAALGESVKAELVRAALTRAG